MKQEKISDMVPNLKSSYSNWFSLSPSIAFLCKYGTNTDGTIPNPFDSISDKITFSENENDDLEFVFYNCSLIAVIIKQTATIDNSFYIDLEKRYGHSITKSIEYGNIELEVKAWYNSGDRIITFQRGKYNDEEVTYLDKSFYYKYANPIIKKLEKKNKKQKSRLD